MNEISPLLSPVALKDPYGSHPFVYKRFGSEFVLYSVGLDGKDQNNKRRTSHNLDDWPLWPRWRSKGYEKWHQVTNPEFYKEWVE